MNTVDVGFLDESVNTVDIGFIDEVRNTVDIGFLGISTSTYFLSGSMTLEEHEEVVSQ